MNANIEEAIDNIQARYRRFGNEFVDESDRGVAILMLCVLEGDLANLFKALVVGADDDVSALAPPGRLSAAVTNAVLLGLLRPEEGSTFRDLAKIRNEFAHRAQERLSFENPPIAGRVDALQFPLYVNGDWNRRGYARKDVFMYAASMLELVMQSRLPEIERRICPGRPYVIVAPPPPLGG